MGSPSHFQINSDYPMDKVVWMVEDSFALSPNQSLTKTYPNSLGARIFVEGVWTNDDWETTKVIDGNGSIDQVVQTNLAYLPTGNVQLVATNATNQAQSANIRIWGYFYEAETLDVVAPPTRNMSANKYIINSDYNYRKLFSEGIADATGTEATVPHNLGFIPQVRLWTITAVADGDSSSPMTQDFIGPSSVGIVQSANVDAANLTLNNYKFYYRIYADEA